MEKRINSAGVIKDRLIFGSRIMLVILLSLSLVGFELITYSIIKPKSAKSASGDMILFWDGTDYTGGALSVPTGWTEISSTYSGRMPRGEGAANFGTTGGSTTHSHTNQTVTISDASAFVNSGLGLTTISGRSHGHDSLPSVSSIPTASSEPASRTIRIIRYNSGIPTTIPNGAIVMFDDSPGMPGSGWTRLSAYDSKVLKVHTTAGTDAGSDTHNHTGITWSGSLGANANSDTPTCSGFLFCASGANGRSLGHSHTAPGSTTSTTDSAIPPYVQPVLAKANADTAISTVGITAMFDGSPGDLWTSRSESGGTYYRKFLRPGSTYGSGGGVAYHTHTATGTSGAASGGSSVGTGSNASGGGATSTHTHQVTANFYAGNSDPNYTGNNDYFLPQYFNVTIAERVNMSLNTYRWYDDNDSEAVTSPWSGLDLASNNMIPSLPAGYAPPRATVELRLRIKILISNQNLPANDVAFKLQYKAGTDSSCTTGSWTDVGAGGGGEIWRFATSGVTDNTTLTTSVLTSTVRELYSKSSPTNTNPNSANTGETIEYDFHIEHNGASAATQYSFRIVESNGNLLSDYAQCPTLVTRPETDNQLRHGEFFQDGVEKGFFWAD